MALPPKIPMRPQCLKEIRAVTYTAFWGAVVDCAVIAVYIFGIYILLGPILRYYLNLYISLKTMIAIDIPDEIVGDSSDDESETSSDEETGFQKLPAEIRLQIFSYTENLTQPRKFYTLALGWPGWDEGLQILYRKQPKRPAALSICSEFRQEALKSWVLFTAKKVSFKYHDRSAALFTARDPEERRLVPKCGPMKRIYVNPSVDMFLFGCLDKGRGYCKLKEYLAGDVGEYSATFNKARDAGIRFDSPSLQNISRRYHLAVHFEATFNQIRHLGIHFQSIEEASAEPSLRANLFKCLRKFSNLETLTVFLTQRGSAYKLIDQPCPKQCVEPLAKHKLYGYMSIERTRKTSGHFKEAAGLIKRHVERLLDLEARHNPKWRPEVHVLVHLSQNGSDDGLNKDRLELRMRLHDSNIGRLSRDWEDSLKAMKEEERALRVVG